VETQKVQTSQKMGRPKVSDKIELLEKRIAELEAKADSSVKERNTDSSVLCPSCFENLKRSYLKWGFCDLISFGGYAEVRMELDCETCSDTWQLKFPQILRANQQNRISTHSELT